MISIEYIFRANVPTCRLIFGVDSGYRMQDNQ